MRIVRNLFAAAFIIAASLSGNAQTHYKGQISLGGHGGVDLSQVLFSPSVKQGFLPGMSAGVNFRYTEENHFALVVEANYMQLGWKEDFEGAPFKYERSIDYIQIPVFAHIYFGRRGKFFVNLGPSVSFKVGSKVKSNFDYSDISNVKDFPLHTSQQYGYPTKADIDYGISGGLGGEFGINPRNSLYLEARYYFGLANVLPSARSDHFRGSNPMSISISLGYWFRVK